MASSIGMTNILTVTRPRAAAKSSSVCRLTSPRCHFHPWAMSLFGSSTLKYVSTKPTLKSSAEAKPKGRQRSLFHHSVERPITLQRRPCCTRPSRTSAGVVYRPLLYPGSVMTASISAWVKRKSCGAFFAVPAMGAAR